MDKALVFGTKDCRFESCQGHAFRNAASVRRSVGLHGRLVQCQVARMVKGLDLRSNAGNCARVRTPQLAQLLLPSWGLLFPCGWRGMPGPALLQLSGGESGLQIGCPLYTPARGLLCGPLSCSQVFLCVACAVARSVWHKGCGATVARLTPDQKVGSSNLYVVILCAHAGLVPSLGTLALRLRA